MFRRNIASARDYLFSTLKYMGSAVESYFIGDLRQALMVNSLFQSELNKKGFKSFGFFGNIQIIKPQTKEALAALLREIDPKAQSRSPYKMLDEVVQGKPFFSESSSESSMHHRAQLMPYLNNSKKYREVIRDTMEEMFDKESELFKQLSTVDDSSNVGRLLVQKIMAKLIFAQDHLPRGANDAIRQMDYQFEGGVFESAFPKALKLLKSRPEKRRLQDAKEAFADFSTQFLEGQLEGLLSLIQRSVPNKPTGNLTADLIADMMRKDKKFLDLAEITAEDLRPYLTHPDIKALPWLFIAGTNISRTLSRALMRVNQQFPEDFIKEFSLFVLDYSIQHFDNLATFPDKPIFSSEVVNKTHDLVKEYLKDASQLGDNRYLKDDNFPLITLILNKLALPDILTKSDLEKRREILSEEKAAQQPKRDPQKDDVPGERLLEAVRAEVEQFNPATMDPQLHQTPALDDFFADAVQNAVGTLQIARYAKQAVKLGDLTIPANTTIIIELSKHHAIELRESKSEQEAPRNQQASEDPKASVRNPFYVFAAGPRMCPGTRLAENIFKIGLANFISMKDAKRLEALENLKKRLGLKSSVTLKPN